MAERIEKQDNNIIYIGTKPFMNYVSSIDIQFNMKGRNEVIIKARGKFINQAVDVAEVVKKRGLRDRKIEVKEIKIDSEEFENKDGRKIHVSTIEIILIAK